MVTQRGATPQTVVTVPPDGTLFLDSSAWSVLPGLEPAGTPSTVTDKLANEETSVKERSWTTCRVVSPGNQELHCRIFVLPWFFSGHPSPRKACVDDSLLPQDKLPTSWETPLSWHQHLHSLGWHSSPPSGCVMLNALRTIKVRVSFTVFLPHFKDLVKTDPHGCPEALEFPGPDEKSRPWLVCKASFKWRAWQLPLWMPACLCPEENGTSTQSSADTEKISQHSQKTDSPLNTLALRYYELSRSDPWCYQIMLQPISVFPGCMKVGHQLSSPTPTLFLETTTVWHLEPTNEYRRSFWGLAFSSAKPINQIFKKIQYSGVI